MTTEAVDKDNLLGDGDTTEAAIVQRHDIVTLRLARHPDQQGPWRGVTEAEYTEFLDRRDADRGMLRIETGAPTVHVDGQERYSSYRVPTKPNDSAASGDSGRNEKGQASLPHDCGLVHHQTTSCANAKALQDASDRKKSVSTTPVSKDWINSATSKIQNWLFDEGFPLTQDQGECIFRIICSEAPSVPVSKGVDWLKEAAALIMPYTSIQAGTWGESLVHDITALASHAAETECLMADCHNPQEHFCFTHGLEVHLPAREIARQIQQMYRSTNEALGYRLKYEPSIEAIERLIMTPPEKQEDKQEGVPNDE